MIMNFEQELGKEENMKTSDIIQKLETQNKLNEEIVKNELKN